MADFVRSEIRQLDSYLPVVPTSARSIVSVPSLSLGLNESPFGPLPGVVDGIFGAAATPNRYPDMTSDSLRIALARHYGLDLSTVVCGPGSVYLLELPITGRGHTSGQSPALGARRIEREDPTDFEVFHGPGASTTSQIVE